MTAALPLLLRSHPHLTTASAESRDFQARVGHPTGTDPAPCVLVLTRAADREIDELSLWLAARGITLLRLDSDRCADTDVQWDPVAGLLTRDGRTFRPQVCWLRYFDVDALRTAQTTPDAVQHVHDQWQALVAALAAHPGLRTLNSGARPGTPDRLTQLAAARAAGLRVPATLVTTRLDVAARGLPGNGDLLVKSLGRHCVEPQPGRLRGVYPQRVTRASIDGEQPTGAPVLVQEYVAADRELRIHAVGGRLIGYAVTRPTPESLWTQPESISVRRCDIPAEVAASLRELLDRFRLDLAAFDLLDTPGGPVFLEVNPEFDWRWTEHGAGDTGTTNAVRALIAAVTAPAHRGENR
ncbi:hypothetical protein G6038_17205 [Rhodococcus sp. 14C212]|uniref:ATP-grasp domain-containing protein n=1 Tax=Rhodococcus sp. 14C212 TaxID=2711209 RepID=UPI0013EB0B0F|nr:hypothetical protein [Rhodococcus sp. 14C212]NGP07186.1 hypothetical protein [Rhodococcus sp. 14C212]